MVQGGHMNAEILGILGTLLGTILGWFLGIISQKGKLYFYTKFEDEFTHADKIGGFTCSSSRDQAEYYSYDLVLDLYNASGEPKIMRKIELAFYAGGKRIIRLTPEDASTKRHTGGITRYDKIQPVTIPAKSILRLNLRGGLNNKSYEFSKIWETSKIVLCFCGKRNIEKHIVVSKKDYKNYWQQR